MTLRHFLRLSVSLFLGIICTTIVSLSLLLLVVNYPGISVNSLHHDFQTVQIVPVIQWSLIPPLRAAVELRWLWTSSSFTLSVGLFPKERLEWLVGLLASAKMYVRMRLAGRFLNRNFMLNNDFDRAWNRSISNADCHGSLPVYISRASSEPPTIPPLIRQSTLAPTLGSRLSSAQSFRPEVLLRTSQFDIRSKPLPADDTVRPSEHSGPQETSQSNEPHQPNPSPHQNNPVPSPAASMLTLADSTYLAPSLGGASSYRTCESIRV